MRVGEAGVPADGGVRAPEGGERGGAARGGGCRGWGGGSGPPPGEGAGRRVDQLT